MNMVRRGPYKKENPGTSPASLKRYRSQLRDAARCLGGGGDWHITSNTKGRIVLQRVDPGEDEDELLHQQLERIFNYKNEIGAHTLHIEHIVECTMF